MEQQQRDENLEVQKQILKTLKSIDTSLNVILVATSIILGILMAK